MWEGLRLLIAEDTESAELFFYVSVTDAVIWMVYRLGGSLSLACSIVYFGVMTAASGLRW